MKIRLAQFGDAKDVFQWRNDPLSRSMSINTDEVILEQHLEWFQKSLQDPAIVLYIGEVSGGKVGICRFNIDTPHARAEVSINLNPGFRSKGLSYPLLAHSIRTFKTDRNLLLTATVKKSNEASKRIFEKCGFSVENEDTEVIKYRLKSS